MGYFIFNRRFFFSIEQKESVLNQTEEKPIFSSSDSQREFNADEEAWR